MCNINFGELGSAEKEKIFWYEFFDELNQRTYEVGFHMDGDLVGYIIYGKTKDDVLHQLVPIEDGASYCWENLKMVGRFERVPEPDLEAPKVGGDALFDDKDAPTKG